MRLHRLRSVALVVASALLLAGGFTACRADPAVAAYVDETRITETEMDQATAGIREVLAEGAPQSSPEQINQQLELVRESALTLRIVTELATSYARQQGTEIPAADPAAVASRVGLAPDHPFVAVVAQYDAAVGALRQGLAPVAPSEADQRQLYDRLIQAGLPPQPFEVVAQQLTVDSVGAVVAERDLIRELAADAQIQVNPRYRPVYRVPWQVAGMELGALDVPLSDPAVVDLG